MLPERDAEQRRVTEPVLHHPMRMIDFGAIGLRRMGLDRSTVIDCDSSDYPVTQMLGAWVYANTAAVDASNIVHGMVWTSRQDDSGLAAIFFGDRLSPASIESKGSGRSLHEGHIEAALLRLALRLGISIVAG